MVACAIPAKMRHLSVNKNFSSDSLVGGGLVFAGISSTQEDWTENQVIAFSEIARSAMLSSRDDLQLNRPDRLIETLGKEEFFHVQQEFAKNHALLKDSITKMAEVSGSSKYIMFSRVLSDTNFHQEDQHENKEKTERITEYRTTRQLVVSTEIYDLATSEVVMSGEMWVNDYNVRSNSKRYGGNFLTDLALNVLENNNAYYPDPPPLDGLIEKAFDGIADNLPRKSCKEIGLVECIKHGFGG